jgi:hypothetical protein
VSSRTIASKSSSIASSHGSSLRLLSRTNISLMPPPMRPLIEKLTLALLSLAPSRCTSPARCEGVGVGVLVGGDEDVFLVGEQVEEHLGARPAARAALGRGGRPATVSTQDSTNAVDAVIAVQDYSAGRDPGRPEVASLPDPFTSSCGHKELRAGGRGDKCGGGVVGGWGG